MIGRWQGPLIVYHVRGKAFRTGANMNCAICGYNLKPDDVDCARCVNYADRGADANLIQSARSNEVELARIQAHIVEMGHNSRVHRTKTICRWSFGAITVICGLLAYEHTASVVHIIETIGACLVALSASLVSFYKIHMANVKKNHKRMKFLEEQLDAKRTSSEPGQIEDTQTEEDKKKGNP